MRYNSFLKCRLANEVTIFLGAVETKWVYEPQRVVTDSRQFFRHPDYNPEDMEASLPADLALIKLPFPIEFNGTHKFKSISPMKILQYWLMLQISSDQLHFLMGSSARIILPITT